ncbi:beta-ketoacyl-[acyl-carrier-protein] synthase family protein [bacterium]|nr:beta-ketoacyl-[acyl-carrier-protein] synthase family protein [bacterium]
MSSQAHGHTVVITGLGIISCLGNNIDEVTKSLLIQRSGIVFDPARKKAGFRSALTGVIRDFDPKTFGVGRRMANTMAEPTLYAYAAAQQALQQSGLDAEMLAEKETGIIMGNDSSARASVEAWDMMKSAGETKAIGAGSIFRIMNSTVSMNLATHLKIKGANWTLSAACASGAHAIGQSAMLIAAGQQEIMLCGGAQEVNMHCMASFDALNAFSTCEQEPEKASRPFDRHRDGLVPSGGAAVIVLESEAHARQRGAVILGTIAGYGFSSDGHHLSLPDVPGSVRAMQKALLQAGIEPKKIDYINAHATSTLSGDAAEAKAITQVFKTCPPVSSTKGITGHECWMAGASEVVYCTLMAQAGFMPVNVNYEAGDEDTDKLNIIQQRIDRKPRAVLSNSFGFGGTNASLVLKY